MAVRIRLTRKGKKKQPTYRVVVADGRAPRDGRYIEQIGRYDPRQEPSVVEIDNDRANYWIGQGAQPSDAVHKLLQISGAVDAPVVTKAIRGDVHIVEADAQIEALEEQATEAATAIEAAAAATEAETAIEAAAEAVTEASDAISEEVASEDDTSAGTTADDDAGSSES